MPASEDPTEPSLLRLLVRDWAAMAGEDLPLAGGSAGGDGAGGDAGAAGAGDVLERIFAEVRACTRCRLCQGRTLAVPGEGDPRARLLFVGEGPGADEDRTGRPFVGRAGQLLTQIIEKGMGLRRQDVFIANVIKCRPPGNRDPAPDEVAACLPYLRAQMEALAPEVIVTLGRISTATLLSSTLPQGKLRGRVHDLGWTKVVPTWHPAYLLRNPAAKRETWEDIKLVLGLLGLPVPPSGSSRGGVAGSPAGA